jgi:hypothetical protein
MIVHRNLRKPSTFEQAAELVGIREAKDRITRRHVRRRSCSNFGNGLPKETLDTLPARIDNHGDYATFNSYQPSDGTGRFALPVKFHLAIFVMDYCGLS